MKTRSKITLAGAAGFIVGALSMFGFLYLKKNDIIEKEADKKYEEHKENLIAAYKRRDDILNKYEKPDISDFSNVVAKSANPKADIIKKEVDKTLMEAAEMIKSNKYVTVNNVFDDKPYILTDDMVYDPDKYVTLYYSYTSDGYLLDDNNVSDDDAMADITCDILDSFANNDELGEIEILRGGRHYIVTKTLGTYEEIRGPFER